MLDADSRRVPTALCALAEKYGCDKTPSILHHYTPLYDMLFRCRPVRRVLEIGILNGASLRMWRDYFPKAEIFGLEINPDVLFAEDRIQTCQCDASDASSLRAAAALFGGHFDLIIDDASHLPSDQITAAWALEPYLAAGGLHVIEDVALPATVSAGISRRHLMIRTSADLFDDCLILIPGDPAI